MISLLAFIMLASAAPTKTTSVCWGPNEARCFRIEGKELKQSLKGVDVTTRALDLKSEASAVAAIDDFTKWMKSKKAGIPLAKKNLCGSLFTANVKGVATYYCFDLAPKKEASAREHALLEALGKKP